MNSILLPTVASLRARLWDGGWRPVPLYNPEVTRSDGGGPIDERSRGKKPWGTAWQEAARRDPPDASVATPRRNALNTGLLCDGLRVVDVDVDDPTLAAKVKALAVTMLGETIMRTRANSGRCALVYRAAEGQPGKRDVKGTFGKVEVLGFGEQLHAFGPHYTGAALHWHPEAPGNVITDSLPAVTETTVGAFLAAAGAIIGADTKAPSDATGDRHASDLGLTADVLDVAAALGVIPNNGAADWEGWNNIALALFTATEGHEVGRAAWHAWSRRHSSYDAKHAEERWQHHSRHKDRVLPEGKEPIGAGTLFALARKWCPGWRKPSVIAAAAAARLVVPPRGPVPPAEAQAMVARALARLEVATADQRRGRLAGAACTLGELMGALGFSAGDAERVLFDALRRAGGGGDEAEARGTIAWGLDRGRRAPLRLEDR